MHALAAGRGPAAHWQLRRARAQLTCVPSPPSPPSPPPTHTPRAAQLTCLRALSHPNIIRLDTMHIDTKELSLCLAFEYCQTDLYEVIKYHRDSRTPMAQYVFKSLAWQLLSGGSPGLGGWYPPWRAGSSAVEAALGGASAVARAPPNNLEPRGCIDAVMHPRRPAPPALQLGDAPRPQALQHSDGGGGAEDCGCASVGMGRRGARAGRAVHHFDTHPALAPQTLGWRARSASRWSHCPITAWW